MSDDLLLTIGTSAMVYPAAEIPRVAVRAEAAVIQVNPQETPLDIPPPGPSTTAAG